MSAPPGAVADATGVDGAATPAGAAGFADRAVAAAAGALFTICPLITVFCSVAVAISELGVAALGFCACLHPDKRVTPESRGMQIRRPISDALIFGSARSMLVTSLPSMRNHMLLRRLFELLIKLP
jgi:hypothetical protein